MFTWVLLAFVAFAQIAAILHALFYKRDPKAAWAWIATCALLPPVGPILYVLLGINRVRTKAKRMKWDRPLFRTHITLTEDSGRAIPLQDYHNKLYKYIIPPHFHSIAHLSEAVTQRPLMGNNRIQPLYNGEEAYPAMIEAINRAKKRVYLGTYIFDTDQWGEEIIRALASAVSRGVEVKVLVDSVGELYSRPRVGKLLQIYQVPFARFLPVSLFSPSGLALQIDNFPFPTFPAFIPKNLV